MPGELPFFKGLEKQYKNSLLFITKLFNLFYSYTNIIKLTTFSKLLFILSEITWGKSISQYVKTLSRRLVRFLCLVCLE